MKVTVKNLCVVCLTRSALLMYNSLQQQYGNRQYINSEEVSLLMLGFDFHRLSTPEKNYLNIFLKHADMLDAKDQMKAL